jgi:hypothetical protein
LEAISRFLDTQHEVIEQVRRVRVRGSLAMAFSRRVLFVAAVDHHTAGNRVASRARMSPDTSPSCGPLGLAGFDHLEPVAPQRGSAGQPDALEMIYPEARARQ